MKKSLNITITLPFALSFLLACQPSLPQVPPASSHSPQTSSQPMASPSVSEQPSSSSSAPSVGPRLKVLAEDTQTQPRPSYAELQPLLDSPLVQKYNAFGFKLFKEIFAEEGHLQNLMISPLSIMLALALVYNGTEGESKAELEKVLELEGFSREEFNRLSGLLQRYLNHMQENSQIEVANSLWADIDDILILPDYVREVGLHYNARLALVDFQGEPKQVADAINGWISQKTRGMIDKILSEEQIRQAVLLLVNTVYFKAKWARPFDPKMVMEEPFYLDDQPPKNHPLMLHRKNHYKYLKNNNFHDSGAIELVSLNYLSEGESKEIGQFVMSILLPEKKKLAVVIQNLQGKDWAELLQQAQTQSKKGYVSIPRFEASYTNSHLEESLQKMGLQKIFDASQANFKRLTSQQTSVSQILHSTRIKVDESGTEAAAVTVVYYPVPFADFSSDFEFTADHPFFYAIHDETTGLILFMGTLINPEDVKK